MLSAARLVKTGKTYSLGVQTGPDSPAYPPRRYSITVLQPAPGAAGLIGSNHATGNDDLLFTWMGIGSQLDGLGHMGVENVYYNGNKAEDFVAVTGPQEIRHQQHSTAGEPRRVTRHGEAVR